MSCYHDSWELIYTTESAGFPHFRICTICNHTDKWQDNKWVSIHD